MNYEYLLLDIKSYVATITINRPPVNALNSQVFKELNNVIDELDANDEVKAIIITGSGEKAFIAGADINEMKDLNLLGMNKMVKVSRLALSKIENSTKPVIAAINGLALGGGFELALACDLRIGSEKVKLAFPEVSLGIIPGGGGTQRIQKIVGQGIAKELLYFGGTINAERALDLQILNKITPHNEVLEVAKKWAEKLAEKPPIALQMMKIAIDTGGNLDTDSGLIIESTALGNAFSTEDRREGFEAFVEKRKPNFKGK